VILHTLGAILSYQSTLGTIFARIFREFAEIFRDFAAIFTDFAQISADFQGFCTDFHQIRTFGDALASPAFLPPTPLFEDLLTCY